MIDPRRPKYHRTRLAVQIGAVRSLHESPFENEAEMRMFVGMGFHGSPAPVLHLIQPKPLESTVAQLTADRRRFVINDFFSWHHDDLWIMTSHWSAFRIKEGEVDFVQFNRLPPAPHLRR